MKKILVILFALVATLSAASFNWEKDYSEAVKKAKEQNKPLLVMVSSPICPECNYMKNNVFIKDEIKNLVNGKYITFQFDIEDKTIPKQMQFWGIPRFYLSKDGENVYSKEMGGMKQDQFMQFVSEGLK